jgi:hypothetical protein
VVLGLLLKKMGKGALVDLSGVAGFVELEVWRVVEFVL